MALTAVPVTNPRGMSNAGVGIMAFVTGASEVYVTGGFELTLTGTGIASDEIQAGIFSAVEAGTGVPDPSLSFVWSTATEKLIAYKVDVDSISGANGALAIAEAVSADIQSKQINGFVIAKSSF